MKNLSKSVGTIYLKSTRYLNLCIKKMHKVKKKYWRLEWMEFFLKNLLSAFKSDQIQRLNLDPLESESSTIQLGSPNVLTLLYMHGLVQKTTIASATIKLL